MNNLNVTIKAVSTKNDLRAARELIYEYYNG